MNVKPKDLVVGGAAGVAILGVIVYNEYRHNKLQKQIDELRAETQTMAKYVKLLEAKIGSELKGAGNRGLMAHAPNPNPEPASEPERDAPKEHHRHHHHHHREPEAAPQVNRRRTETPVRRAAPPRRRVAEPEPEEDSDEAESPPISNRRARQPRPTKPISPSEAAAARAKSRPQRIRPTQPKEEVVEEMEPVEAKQNSTRIERAPTPPVSDKKPSIKRFAPMNEDDNAGVMVSSRRNGQKSILKNGKGKEDASDDDLLGDIESMAKSSKRVDDSEGRPDSVSGNKARMERTRQIAAMMQKKREEKLAESTPKAVETQ